MNPGVPGAGGCPTALKLDRYKTKLCLFHMQGRCCKGPHCPYAHGIDELRAPLPPGLLQVAACCAAAFASAAAPFAC